MSGCSGCGSGGGPFAEGRELVEFVYQAHGGTLRDRPVPNGGLPTTCQGCGGEFMLTTFVGCCPHCDGIHAVSPPRAHDPSAIQFAGKDFRFPG